MMLQQNTQTENPQPRVCVCLWLRVKRGLISLLDSETSLSIQLSLVLALYAI